MPNERFERTSTHLSKRKAKSNAKPKSLNRTDALTAKLSSVKQRNPGRGVRCAAGPYGKGPLAVRDPLACAVVAGHAAPGDAWFGRAQARRWQQSKPPGQMRLGKISSYSRALRNLRLTCTFGTGGFAHPCVLGEPLVHDVAQRTVGPG